MPAGSKPGERRGGRQKGVPNKATAAVRAVAQKYTEEVIAILLRIARDEKGHPNARVSACKELLDRGHGKAPQAITGEDGGPLIPTIVIHKLSC